LKRLKRFIVLIFQTVHDCWLDESIMGEKSKQDSRDDIEEVVLLRCHS